MRFSRIAWCNGGVTFSDFASFLFVFDKHTFGNKSGLWILNVNEITHLS